MSKSGYLTARACVDQRRRFALLYLLQCQYSGDASCDSIVTRHKGICIRCFGFCARQYTLLPCSVAQDAGSEADYGILQAAEADWRVLNMVSGLKRYIYSNIAYK